MSQENTTTPVVAKKNPYVSRFSSQFNEIVAALMTMKKNYAESEKTILIALKNYNTKVVALEKAFDKYDKKRRDRVIDASQSYVGVNQPKRVHHDLLSFLEANKSRIGEKASKCVRPFMSLNEVNQCILNLSKTAGVVSENKYKFNASTAEASFVNSLRDLLVTKCPANFYQIPLDFNAEIETKKMSSWFKHLLTEDADSKAFTQTLIDEKRAAIASAAAIASSTAASDETSSTMMAVETTETTSNTTTTSSEETQPKKRKILRKTNA
jgi:hypothetical protein